MDRRTMIARLTAMSAVLLPSSVEAKSEEAANREHMTWVAAVLNRMSSIKPGMTRENLLSVFTTEGGLSSRTHRTYVSQDCPFFKVDVDFSATSQPRDRERLAGSDEDMRDVIITISRPYLQSSISD